jgi:hypothetical protein
MNKFVAILVVSAFLLALPITARAQSKPFQVSAHFASANSTEFDQTDLGVGGRISWNPVSLIGFESELTFFPAAFPDGFAFSSSRLESLSGITFGPRFDRVRPFARLRAGFQRYAGSPEALICIQIFPPPLICEMASGPTVPAFDVGGGVEISTSGSTFLRADIGDRMLKYPGPASSKGRLIPESGFIGHDFRFALGGGLTF